MSTSTSFKDITAIVNDAGDNVFTGDWQYLIDYKRRTGSAEAYVFKDGSTHYAYKRDGTLTSSGAAASTVIQAALDGMSSGGTLFLGKATYQTAVPIGITFAGTTIDSDGATLQATADVGASGMLDAVDLSNITIKNLIFDANNIARRTLQVYTDSVDISNIHIENVETKNTITGFIWSGLRVSASFSGGKASNVTLKKLYIHDHDEASKDNVSIGRVEGLEMSGCVFETLGKNVLFYGGSNHVMSNNRFISVPTINLQGNHTNFTGNGVYGTSSFLSTVQVSGFDADGNPDARDTEDVSIKTNTLKDTIVKLNEGGAEAAKRITVSTNNIVRPTINTDNGNDSGIIIQGQGAANEIQILNNLIRGHGRAGILLDNSDYILMSGNTFVDNGGNTAISVRGNIVDFDAANPGNHNQIINNDFMGNDLTVVKHIWIRGDNNTIFQNKFIGTATTVIDDDGTNTIRNNSGYVTENSGTATVASGTTSIAVTHGLDYTPTLQDIAVAPTNNLGNATKWWVSTPTSTQFTINVDADPGATTATFVWGARRV